MTDWKIANINSTNLHTLLSRADTLIGRKINIANNNAYKIMAFERSNALNQFDLWNQIIALFKFNLFFSLARIYSIYWISIFHNNILVRSMRSFSMLSFFLLLPNWNEWNLLNNLFWVFFSFDQLKPIYRSFRTVYKCELTAKKRGKEHRFHRNDVPFMHHQMAADRRRFSFENHINKL